MKITGNEPAYAKSAFYHPDGGIDPSQTGLTIRQQFAMAAMQAVVSWGNENSSIEQDISLSVKYADALIAELNRTEG